MHGSWRWAHVCMAKLSIQNVLGSCIQNVLGSCLRIGSGGSTHWAMAPLRKKTPDCDAEHLVDLLCTYVLHVGHSVAFDLGCYAGVVVSQAIRGAGLAWNLVCFRECVGKHCSCLQVLESLHKVKAGGFIQVFLKKCIHCQIFESEQLHVCCI